MEVRGGRDSLSTTAARSAIFLCRLAAIGSVLLSARTVGVGNFTGVTNTTTARTTVEPVTTPPSPEIRQTCIVHEMHNLTQTRMETYTCNQLLQTKCGWWRTCAKYQTKICYRIATSWMLANVTVKVCCDGWSEDQHGNCTVPVCFPPCRHGGVCINSKGIPGCVCAPGYTGQYCEMDIDECKTNHSRCNQTCSNLAGSYKCGCYETFVLVEDGFTCLPASEVEMNSNKADMKRYGMDGPILFVGIVASILATALLLVATTYVFNKWRQKGFPLSNKHGHGNNVLPHNMFLEPNDNLALEGIVNMAGPRVSISPNDNLTLEGIVNLAGQRVSISSESITVEDDAKRKPRIVVVKKEPNGLVENQDVPSTSHSTNCSQKKEGNVSDVVSQHSNEYDNIENGGNKNQACSVAPIGKEKRRSRLGSLPKPPILNFSKRKRYHVENDKSETCNGKAEPSGTSSHGADSKGQECLRPDHWYSYPYTTKLRRLSREKSSSGYATLKEEGASVSDSENESSIGGSQGYSKLKGKNHKKEKGEDDDDGIPTKHVSLVLEVSQLVEALKQSEAGNVGHHGDGDDSVHDYEPISSPASPVISFISSHENSTLDMAQIPDIPPPPPPRTSCTYYTLPVPIEPHTYDTPCTSPYATVERREKRGRAKLNSSENIYLTVSELLDARLLYEATKMQRNDTVAPCPGSNSADANSPSESLTDSGIDGNFSSATAEIGIEDDPDQDIHFAGPSNSHLGGSLSRDEEPHVKAISENRQFNSGTEAFNGESETVHNVSETLTCLTDKSKAGVISNSENESDFSETGEIKNDMTVNAIKDDVSLSTNDDHKVIMRDHYGNETFINVNIESKNTDACARHSDKSLGCADSGVSDKDHITDEMSHSLGKESELNCNDDYQDTSTIGEVVVSLLDKVSSQSEENNCCSPDTDEEVSKLIYENDTRIISGDTYEAPTVMDHGAENTDNLTTSATGEGAMAELPVVLREKEIRQGPDGYACMRGSVASGFLDINITPGLVSEPHTVSEDAYDIVHNPSAKELPQKNEPIVERDEYGMPKLREPICNPVIMAHCCTGEPPLEAYEDMSVPVRKDMTVPVRKESLCQSSQEIRQKFKKNPKKKDLSRSSKCTSSFSFKRDKNPNSENCDRKSKRFSAVSLRPLSGIRNTIIDKFKGLKITKRKLGVSQKIKERRSPQKVGSLPAVLSIPADDEGYATIETPNTRYSMVSTSSLVPNMEVFANSGDTYDLCPPSVTVEIHQEAGASSSDKPTSMGHSLSNDESDTPKTYIDMASKAPWKADNIDENNCEQNDFCTPQNAVHVDEQAKSDDVSSSDKSDTENQSHNECQNLEIDDLQDDEFQMSIDTTADSSDA